MIVQEIIDSAKRDIGQDGGGFTDEKLLDMANEGLTDFCRYTEMLEKSTDTTVAALDGVLNIPSDFLESRQMRWSYNKQVYPKSERVLDYGQRDWIFEVGSPAFSVYFNYDQLRLKPINDSAGTVKYRHAYIPGTMQLSSTPPIPTVWHDAIIDFIAANCSLILKEYENATMRLNEYLKKRRKAKQQSRDGQRTPDTMLTMRTVNVFNYPLWDQGYRTK